MGLVRIIVGWLTAPRQLLALAGLCMAAGILWGYATVQENANRTLALRQGPPAPVAVEDYRRAVNRGPAGEVVLRAAADPSRPLVLSMPGTGERRLAVPLYPLSGGAEATGAILLPLAPGVTPAEAGPLAHDIGDGLVEINGRAVEAGDFALILAGALAAEGRVMGPSFVAVQPYVEGRDAALQPVADPSRSWLWPMVLGLALALASGYRRFAGNVRFVPRLGGSAPRAPAPAPGAASARFAPLPRQEEVNVPEDPVAGERILAGGAAALAAAVAAARLALRGAAALLRLLRAGVGELRSPR
jgi:hypothetical protein